MSLGEQPAQPALGEETIFSHQTGARPVPPPAVPLSTLNFDVEDAFAQNAPPFVAAQRPSAVPPPISPGTYNNSVSELQRATAAAISGATADVSKDELAVVLEGFARVLRGDTPASTDVRLVDHHAEVDELKELLLEAQETIIDLLNDRVFDRAKLAKLESEVRVLPDLQSQASRAMGLAIKTEEFQQELEQVRADVERLRTNYVRNEKSSSGFMDWLLGRNQTP